MPRRSSLAAWFGVSAVLVGCAGAAPRRHHHQASPDDDDQATGAPSAAPLGPWPAFARLASFQVVGDVPHSAHRVGTDTGHIVRSPDALPDLKQLQPAGAILAEALSSTPDAAPSQYFVMERSATGEGWTYLVVEPSGALVASGNLALCARCHAEAGPTRVFGP